VAIADESTEGLPAAEATAATTDIRRKSLRDLDALLTAEDVLFANELRRSRVWVWCASLLGVAGLGCAAFVSPADDLARIMLAVGCVVLLITNAVALWVLADSSRYTQKLVAVYSYICVCVMIPAYYFFGWFSGILLLVPLGAVSFALGQEAKSVIALAVLTIGSHAVLASLTIAGVIKDSGLATLRVPDVSYQALYVALAAVMFGVSFAFGHALRRHTQANVERYGTAVRETARREALLQEALDELARVRRIGEPGRFTGLDVGSYRLGVVLGRGAMGEVYAADQQQSGAVAAVKVMSSAGVLEPHAIARFEREIEIARSVDSPHIVRVLEHSGAEDQIMYLAMERLTGQTLSRQLRGNGRASGRETVDMLSQIARGVDAAHRAGVIHRDLKPGNLFRHDAGGTVTWKVLDFGVSKLAGSGGTLTGGGLVGTPNYMSPEQAAGGDVDHRTDVFSLGCIAYRCLTGYPAFSGREIVDVLYAIVNQMPQRPSFVGRLPEQVDLVLAIALAKDAEHRFNTASDFAAALVAAHEGSISDDLERRGEGLLALTPWA